MAVPLPIRIPQDDRFEHTLCGVGSTEVIVSPLAAIRNHLTILTTNILHDLNTNNRDYKFILTDEIAAHYYLSPYLLNVLKASNRLDFTEPVSLVGFSLNPPRPYPGNGTHVWTPKGDDAHPLYQPAFENFVQAIRREYASLQEYDRASFRSRELCHYLYNIGAAAEYNIEALGRNLSNGAAFETAAIDIPGYRIWQLKLKIPLIRGGEETVVLVHYRNAFYRECFEDLNPDGQGTLKLVGEDTRVDRNLYWREGGVGDSLEDISIPIRYQTEARVVIYDILISQFSRQVYDDRVHSEVLGRENRDILYSSLQHMGLPKPHFPAGGNFAFGMRLDIPLFKHRLILQYCLLDLKSEIENGRERLRNPLDFVKFFSPCALLKYNLRRRIPNTLQIHGQQYPFLNYLFQENMVGWYIYRVGDQEKLLTREIGAGTPEKIVQYNSITRSNEGFLLNHDQLARAAIDGISYQDLLRVWIDTNQDDSPLASARFHTKVNNHLVLMNKSRYRFWQGLGDIDPVHIFMKRALRFAYEYPVGSVNHDTTLFTTRFSYPLSVVYKSGDLTRLGIVDTLQIGRIVHTSSFLSTTTNQSGNLQELATFRNVLNTGFTLYKFELKNRGFLYATYDYQLRGYANEKEVLIPAWTAFQIVSKQWKYIPIVDETRNEELKFYRLVQVITLKQIPETYEAMLRDIPNELLVPAGPVPAAVAAPAVPAVDPAVAAHQAAWDAYAQTWVAITLTLQGVIMAGINAAKYHVRYMNGQAAVDAITLVEGVLSSRVATAAAEVYREAHEAHRPAHLISTQTADAARDALIRFMIDGRLEGSDIVGVSVREHVLNYMLGLEAAPAPAGAAPPPAPVAAAAPPAPEWPIKQTANSVYLSARFTQAQADQLQAYLNQYSDSFRALTNFDFRVKNNLLDQFACYGFTMIHTFKRTLDDHYRPTLRINPHTGQAINPEIEPLVAKYVELIELNVWNPGENNYGRLTKMLDHWLNFIGLYITLMDTAPVITVNNPIYSNQANAIIIGVLQIISTFITYDLYRGGPDILIARGSLTERLVQRYLDAYKYQPSPFLIQYPLINSYGLTIEGRPLYEHILSQIVGVYGILNRLVGDAAPPGPMEAPVFQHPVVPAVGEFPLCNQQATPDPIQVSTSGQYFYAARQLTPAEKAAFLTGLARVKTELIAAWRRDLGMMGGLRPRPPPFNDALTDGFFYVCVNELEKFRPLLPAAQLLGVAQPPPVPPPKNLLISNPDHRGFTSVNQYIEAWINNMRWLYNRPAPDMTREKFTTIFLLLETFTKYYNQYEAIGWAGINFYRPSNEPVPGLLYGLGGFRVLHDPLMDPFFPLTKVETIDQGCKVLPTNGFRDETWINTARFILKIYLASMPAPAAGGQRKRKYKHKTRRQRKLTPTKQSQL